MKKLDEILDMCPNFYDRESFANGYLKGYHQAEKDLELTWEDIALINTVVYEMIRESNKFLYNSKKEYYQEILKRFKAVKYNGLE